MTGMPIWMFMRFIDPGLMQQDLVLLRFSRTAWPYVMRQQPCRGDLPEPGCDGMMSSSLPVARDADVALAAVGQNGDEASTESMARKLRASWFCGAFLCHEVAQSTCPSSRDCRSGALECVGGEMRLRYRRARFRFGPAR